MARKSGVSKTRRRSSVAAQTIIQHGLIKNPEVRTVLEIAMRARELESTQEPISIETTSEFRPTSTISQTPGI
jgi:hypothetical protein